MSSNTEDRKRLLEVELGSVPVVKRQDIDESNDDADPASIEATRLMKYRYDAICRQISEDRREIARQKHYSDAIKKKYVQVESNLEIFSRYFAQFFADIQRLSEVVTKQNSEVIVDSETASDTTHIFSSLLLTEDESQIQKELQSLVDVYKDSYQTLLNLTKQNCLTGPILSSDSQLNAQKPIFDSVSRSFQLKNTHLNNELLLANRRTQELTSEIDNLSFDLNRAHRKIERLQSQLEQFSKSAVVATSTSTTQNQHSSALTTSDSTNENVSLEVERLKNELQATNESLLRIKDELEAAVKQKSSLDADIVLLRVELKGIPEERISQSPYVKELEQRLKNTDSMVESSRSSTEKLYQEISELLGAQQGFRDALIEEEKQRRSTLEKQLIGNDSEIQKLKSEKEHLERLVDTNLRRATLAEASLDNLNTLAKTNEQRYTCLKELLKRTMAKEIDANVFNQTFISKSLLFDSKDAEKRIADLEAQLRSQNKMEPFTLKQDVSVEDQIKALVSEQTALMSEIETIVAAFDEVQEHNVKLLRQIEEKDSLISKLMNERLKGDQAFSILQKEHEIVASRLSGHQKQSVLQAELLKKWEQRERNLVSQISSLEREMSMRMATIDKEKRHTSELQQQITMLQSRSDPSKIKELQHALREKIENLDREIYRRKRAEDDRAVVKKRLEYYEKYESLGDDALRTELESYKQLLKCTCCRQRQKDTVLTRCFHVFCKECIDTRLETRQRKCPNCGDAFGANDVRAIYL